MIKASDFITRVLGIKAKAGYIVKDSLSSSVLYFFNLSDSSVVPLDTVYLPDTKVPLPQYHGSDKVPSANMDFYKCASVNTSDSTWRGYKAVQNPQTLVYSYLNTLTSDTLIYYADKSSPVVNNVYTADAICCIDIYDLDKAAQKELSLDLVFYAPLNITNLANALVGVQLTPTMSGTPTYSTVAGIPCMQCGQTITYSKPDDFSLAGLWTAGMWIYTTGQANSGICTLWKLGQVPGYLVGIGFYLNKPVILPVYLYFSDISINNGWHNLTATYNGSTQAKLYMDGEFVKTVNYALGSSVIVQEISIHPYVYGYIANLRIYNTVLSALKIQKLANLLHPTNS